MTVVGGNRLSHIRIRLRLMLGESHVGRRGVLTEGISRR